MSSGPRLGRPPLPVAEVKGRPGWVGCEDRIAWLLRANRFLGPDDRFAVGSEFARAFAGTPTFEAVDSPQISRWERAKQRVDYRIVQRYEQLLELPASSLTSTADTVYREVRGTPGVSELTRGTDPDDRRLRRRTHELLDRVLSDDVMPGVAWNELTANLLAIGTVFLHPPRIWSMLAERLIAEMIISDGLEWHHRSESLSRLLGHPNGELPVIDACTSLVADPTNQIYIDPLTALEVSSHPESAVQLLKQIANPANDHAALGAWYAIVEKIGRGHFTPDALTVLVRHATTMLTSHAEHTGIRSAAVEVLRQTPALVSRHALAAVRNAFVAHDPVPSRSAGGANDRAYALRTLVRQLTVDTISLLPGEPMGNDDPMLCRLLGEMLAHPQITYRVQAAKLIEVTPYRAPVAAALAAKLRQRSAFMNEAVAAPILLALTSLGGEPERRLVERLIVADGIGWPVASAAAWALGHVRGTSDDHFYATALRRAIAGMEHTPMASSVGRGIIYSMGIGRHMDFLKTLAGAPVLPPRLRTAAAWWVGLPMRVLQSTDRGMAAPAT